MASVQRQCKVVPAGSPIPNARTTTTTTNDYNNESTITKKDDTHSSNNTVTPVLTVTQRRAERTTTVRAPRARVLWEECELSGVLAWICRNRDRWQANKIGSVREIHDTVVKKPHSVNSILSKIRTMENEYVQCFEYVTYDGNDEPIRRVIPDRARNHKLFKECRAAFGPPVYVKGMNVRRIPAPPPSLPLQQQQQAQATLLPQNDASSSGSSSAAPLPSPSTRCPESIPEPHTPQPSSKRTRTDSSSSASAMEPAVKRRNRGHIVSARQHDHQQTEQLEEDLKQKKGRAVSSCERRMMTEDQAREMELKNEELHMMIQGIETKMKRADLRFERNKARHEKRQARRLRRITKYQDALGKLALPSMTTFVAPK
ncbi:hypothetical protein BDB00DRAFT_876352 [Zychaea mexicana]|uniref:uncharacterized protein n=1 Tax=Zychaea mexicana TaxID=64656 RepID=UPI0022FDE579|nr:uncharacterized protein BDB00DRAFT_876352 [Zychaea mexicana]KAI9489478.1 hypothetical protein BDB00DRAFT_876352 [Zychaea mexicana]